ncbi:MAG: FtsQ-type POTRA domain-containing protein, partial [Proteobacteria bacterium]|nr:FtsQ-type POTRA domain-containing protein [Pseudomonadota bacterium]
MRGLIPTAWWRSKARGSEISRSRRGHNTAKRPRRNARNTSNRRLWRRTGIGAAASVVVLGLAGLWYGGWVERGVAAAGRALLAATVEAGFKVDDVLVEGRARTKRSAILEALGVARDTPILAFDPHAAKRRLEALPWVRAAIVERRLPEAIFVRLVERKPRALWQHQGRLAVIDRGGDVIPGAKPEAFAHLPLVVGKGAPGHAADLLAMLDSEPELRTRVSAAVRVRDRRWNLRLDGGIDVRLPEHNPAAAWAELARIQR